MEWIILLLLIFAVLVRVITHSPQSKEYNYSKRKYLFSKAERSFFGVLDQAVGNEFSIFGKVRVADILTPRQGLDRKNWQKAFNKISAKHFDFVLCDKQNLEVLAVVELDDKSHNSKKAKLRDELINKACESAGIKLIRITARANYQTSLIRDQVKVIVEGERSLGEEINN